MLTDGQGIKKVDGFDRRAELGNKNSWTQGWYPAVGTMARGIGVGKIVKDLAKPEVRPTPQYPQHS